MYVLTRLDPPYAPGQYQAPIIAQGFNQQADGTVTVTVQDGCVLSIQPDGEVQHRAPGFNGYYEIATVVGNQLQFCPNGAAAYLYGFVDQCPVAQPTSPPADVPPEDHVKHQQARAESLRWQTIADKLERGQGVEAA